MNIFLNIIILSILPISELRGAIPVGIVYGVEPWIVFLICVFANSLVIPLVFLFLDFFHFYFMKINLYNKLFNHYLERSRKKIEKNIGIRGEFLALMIFVGIPLPATGAYTGALLAWFLNIERKKAYLAIFLGIIISAIIMTIIILGGFNFFNFLINF